MLVSVIIETYSMDRFPDLVECVDSIKIQTYNEIETIVAVDGNDKIAQKLCELYGNDDDVRIVWNDSNAGPISRANLGAICASGELVALIDDDAVAEADWIERLVEAYNRHDAVAVGGKIVPEWVAGEATHIPAEFYFLIGATHRGFATTEREVRNTFGANLAIARDAYLHLGGIKLGGIDDSRIQGRETEFCARLSETYGTGVIYTPDAVVRHRIYDYRMQVGWLLRRAFWQGYSKRAMGALIAGSTGEETAQLTRLLTEFIPGRIGRLLRRPRRDELVQLAMLVALLIVTGMGYLYGLIRWR
jgi:GT2 family glycosyltransferase/preprotein translocase subunit Sss1